ncbi:hypothetical protein PIB30_061560 [Stylosanthes scabra]|uniref:Uncharacterized protein n=1 Tax=Stylosanthes scabra TaxID=79078 RepID=A0ABU6VLU7_9FABA|nr:hypothetical protein [Stylosanthes scabra]
MKIKGYAEKRGIRAIATTASVTVQKDAHSFKSVANYNWYAFDSLIGTRRMFFFFQWADTFSKPVVSELAKLKRKVVLLNFRSVVAERRFKAALMVGVYFKK